MLASINAATSIKDTQFFKSSAVEKEKLCMSSVMFWLQFTWGLYFQSLTAEPFTNALQSRCNVEKNSWGTGRPNLCCTPGHRCAFMHFAAALTVSQPISTGTSVLEVQGEGLGWDCFNRKGRALSGEHMKGQLRHLGELMTDWAALFWLNSSFNMHDKSSPSGTFPGNSTESPDKPLLFLLPLFNVSWSAMVEVPSKCKSKNLLLVKAHPACFRSALLPQWIQNK